MAKDVYTTGEVAEICKISQQTVIRCFDAGRLRGFRVPGSRFRRIPREALAAFMRENNIPLDNLESQKRRIMVVDDDPDVVELLLDLIGRDGRFEVQSAGNGYDAGIMTMQFRPEVVLLDYLLPDINGNIVCRRIRTTPELAETKIIIVSGAVKQAEIDGLLAAGANEFIKKPFDLNHLIERICSLLRLAPRPMAS